MPWFSFRVKYHCLRLQQGFRRCYICWCEDIITYCTTRRVCVYVVRVFVVKEKEKGYIPKRARAVYLPYFSFSFESNNKNIFNLNFKLVCPFTLCELNAIWWTIHACVCLSMMRHYCAILTSFYPKKKKCGRSLITTKITKTTNTFKILSPRVVWWSVCI